MTHKVENTVFGQCKFECVYCLDFIQSLPILHHVGICTAANSTYASPSSILFISVATQVTAAPSEAHKAARWHLDIFLTFYIHPCSLLFNSNVEDSPQFLLWIYFSHKHPAMVWAMKTAGNGDGRR